MIDPDNLKEVEQLTTEIKLSDGNGLPEYDFEDYDFNSEKDFKKYIADIEKDVRHSREYQVFIQFLKDNMDMNHCSFFEKVSNKESNHIKIEIHHTPFTLYDICIIVYNKRAFYGEDLSIFQIAKEVAICHYNLTIGLIPLSKTIHELVHNGYLFIPADRVFGRYDYFVEYYKDFIGQDLLDTLDKVEQYTDFYKDNMYNRELIEEKHVFINPEGSYKLPVYDNIRLAMDNQIQAIKDNHHQLPTLVQHKEPIYADNNAPAELVPAFHFVDENEISKQQLIPAFHFI